MTQVITKDDALSAEDLAAKAAADQAAAEAAFESVDEPVVKTEAKAEKNAEPKQDPKTDDKPTKTEAEIAAETKAAEEAAAKATAEAEWEGVPPKVRQTLEAISGKVGVIDKLQHDVKSIAGRTGAALEGVHALRTAMEAAKAVTKAGGDAPTQAQIAAAAENDKEWQELLEEFPAWQAGIDKRIDVRMEARLAKLALPPNVDVAGLKTEMSQIIAQATSEAKAEAREMAKIDRKYENWEDDVKTPEFAAWREAQAPEVQALGASSKAADAIKMLDLYADQRKAAAKAAETEARNKKRLDAAITPRGVPTPSHRPISEREAMERGFASVDE